MYVAACALLIVRLSWNVVRLRRSHQVSLGDGGNRLLQRAIAAQENATEYIPVTLLLLMALEFNGAPLLLVHLFGIVFVVGRLLHAYGVVRRFQWRVRGMLFTYAVMIGLSLVNLVYLPYEKLI
ncbi:MAG: MAPEG family protein [Thioalkalispiraceae bacterium]|jgi:hypothetical protein